MAQIELVHQAIVSQICDGAGGDDLAVLQEVTSFGDSKREAGVLFNQKDGGGKFDPEIKDDGTDFFDQPWRQTE